MSGDAPPSKPNDHVVLPGLIMAALAVVGYLTAQPALKTARPATKASSGFPLPNSVDGLHAFYARLWEDPLEMSYEQEGKSELETLQSQLKEYFHPSESESSADLKNNFADVIGDPPRKLTCLPVMLPGAPDGDDHEQRRRTTYAIYAVLAQCGYILDFPKRISFVDVRVNIDLPVFHEALRDRPFRVPVKLFHKASRSENVDDVPADSLLVLWINEDLAERRPLNVITQILSSLFETAPDWQDRIDLRIIGPFTSEGLVHIYGDLDDPTQDATNIRKFFKVSVYSARATVPKEELPARPRAPAADNDKIHIIRTIGDDHALSQAMVAELKLRCKLTADSTIVLLTEQDTLYGQKFCDVFNDSLTYAVGQMTDIHTFKYLRGIDGEIPGRGNAKTSRSPQPQPGAGNDALAGANPNDDIRPSGNSQLDYLIRLGDDLFDLNRQKYLQSGQGIKAIGIVGSDVFDKLLILRALRKQLPDVVFFTTDLDAEFADANEHPTARNLIVASHFGLQLEPKLQRETPPFRDSYQTSTFFAALTALEARSVKQAAGIDLNDPWGYAGPRPDRSYLAPLLFEVGLQGPYQLTMTGEPKQSATAVVQPRSPREQTDGAHTFHLAAYFFGAVLSLGFCLFIYASGLRRFLSGGAEMGLKKFLGTTAISVAVLLLLALVPLVWIFWDHRRPDGQPFAITDGISLWPATLVRYLAALVALASIYISLQDLKKTTDNLDQKLSAHRAAGRFGWRRFLERWSEGGWRQALLEVWDNVFVFNWPKKEHPGVEPPTATALYGQFAQRGAWPLRLLRIVPLTIAYLAFGGFLTLAAGEPSRPYRGPWSDWTSRIVLIFSAVLMVALVFLVIDATQLCRRFIGALKNARLNWSSPELADLYVARGAPPDEHGSIDSLFTVRVIAECSHVVGNLIICPFVVLFLMVAARLPTFEFPDVTWVLILLWSVISVGAIIATLYVRKSAAATRNELLRRLEDQLAASSANDQKERRRRLRRTIEAIEQESGGAFGSLWEDPIVTALAIPFGGATGALLIQQLLPVLLM